MSLHAPVVMVPMAGVSWFLALATLLVAPALAAAAVLTEPQPLPATPSSSHPDQPTGSIPPIPGADEDRAPTAAATSNTLLDLRLAPLGGSPIPLLIPEGYEHLVATYAAEGQALGLPVFHAVDGSPYDTFDQRAFAGAVTLTRTLPPVPGDAAFARQGANVGDARLLVAGLRNVAPAAYLDLRIDAADADADPLHYDQIRFHIPADAPRLDVLLEASNGAGTAGATLTDSLGRQVVALDGGGPGSARTTVDLPAPGTWTLTLKGGRAGDLAATVLPTSG